MKKLHFLTMLALVMLLVSAVPVAAQDAGTNGEPIAGCPPGFDHLHQVPTDGTHDHSGHGEHQHVGNDQDQNGDGWICGKHAGKDGKIHVHADNNYPRGS